MSPASTQGLITDTLSRLQKEGYTVTSVFLNDITFIIIISKATEYLPFQPCCLKNRESTFLRRPAWEGTMLLGTRPHPHLPGPVYAGACGGPQDIHPPNVNGYGLHSTAHYLFTKKC